MHDADRRCFFVHKERKAALISVKALTVSAMLAAMSVTIGIFCKTFLNFGSGLFRVTFENLPIVLCGITFGPFMGAIVGVATDIVSYLLSPQAYPPNFIVTFGAGAIGAISGAVSRLLNKHTDTVRITVSIVTAHFFGSMIIKSIGLFAFYGWAVLFRIPVYILITAVEIIILNLLFKNRSFRMIFDDISGYGRHVSAKTEEDTDTMTYEQAIEYIHSVCWKGSRPGLERITELCTRLGNPQDDLKFIHVTGTNGKGSTCAMTESVLRCAGYKTGLFTSPYVKFFNERIRINGADASNERLAYATSLVKPHADAMEDAPTEFELITAIGFMLFKLEGCDIVILEAGMGGRLDSTNVIKNSVVSVITGVALEHTEYLGDTVEKIAYEKAGIIKEGCPVVYGGSDIKEQGAAYKVISARASELGAPLHLVDYDALDLKEATLDGTVLDYKEHADIQLSLLGLYQPQNCARALEIIEVLRLAGYIIDDFALQDGIKKTVWRARFEKLRGDPIVLYDGSHNPEGIEVAARTLKHYFGDKKVNILTGVMADKDYRGMMGTLAPLVNKAFAVTPDNPRALEAKDLKSVFRRLRVKCSAFDSIQKAVDTAVSESKKDGSPLICLGSLYMYAEISDAVENNKRTESK